MKNWIAAAAMALSPLPALAFDVEAMSDAERAAFRAEIRAYLLDNPGIIVEAYTLYSEQQEAQQAANETTLLDDYAEQIFADGVSYIGGNPDGDITLVEFLDYRCGYCRKAHDDVQTLLEEDGNIRLIVKELPILGDDSVMASRFAIAAKEVAGDTAYKAVHDEMMSYRGAFTKRAFAKLANGLDLDGDAIVDAMDSAAVNQTIGANHQLASILSINGTPTFILEDQLLRGYVPLDGMVELVAAARGE